MVGWLKLGPSSQAILVVDQNLLINQMFVYVVELVRRWHGGNTVGKFMEGDLEVPLQISENSLATYIKISTMITST